MNALQASAALASLGIAWGWFTSKAYIESRRIAERKFWRGEDKGKLNAEIDRLDRIMVWHRVVSVLFAVPLVLHLLSAALFN